MTKSLEKSIASFVHTRIMSIQSDYLSPDRKSRGARHLATLRHALTMPIGSSADAWPLEFEGLPLELVGRSSEPSSGESAVHYALSLYAHHQQGKTNPMYVGGKENRLGSAVRALVRKERDCYSNLEDGEMPRRFRALVTAESMEETVHYARQLVQQLRSAGIPVDYARLASQLYDLQNPYKADAVRLAWGREYAFAGTDEADSEN